MVYFHGDIHGHTEALLSNLRRFSVQPGDTVVLLGDVGLNYHIDNSNDKMKKAQLEKTGVNFLCVHGNHERRPGTIPSYREKVWRGGKVYAENDYPHLYFAEDGEIFDLEGYKAVALGGAYSVDKYYRLAAGWSWFSDEQPTGEIKEYAEKKLSDEGWKVDIVLSHTCPSKYIPVESFIPNIDQSTVDRSTEEWLDMIEDRLNYKTWYCGHWHIDKHISKIRFLYRGIECLTEKGAV